MDGRTANGRFTAGHRFSRGKLPGERNRATLMAERLLSKDVTAAMRKIGAAVRAGEPWALKFIGERFVPLTSRQTFIGPIDYTAPTTPEEARAMILDLGERVARNELSIEAHDVLLAISGPISATRRPNSKGRSMSWKTPCAMEESHEL